MPQNPDEMSIWEHLDELRMRLFYAAIALVITTVISFTVAEKFIDLLSQPIGGIEKLVSIDVTENIGVYMRVSLLGGVILAMPVIVYQLLKFIMPGLTKEENKWVLIAVPMMSLLFLGGVSFAYYIMLPAALPFLTSFAGIKTIPRPSNYIQFTTNLMFWIGLSFETPLFIFVLAKFKIVNAPMLLKQWRYAIVIIAIIAAVVTPTVDPINMSLMMAPLILLYFLSILLAAMA